jgi:uncharacterized protein YceH (UPF0502 family)
MAEFTDAAQVEAALEALARRESGPLVRRLAREPGRRESRYAHLFGTRAPDAAADAAPDAPEPAALAQPAAGTPAASATDAMLAERVAALEREVSLLREEIERIRRVD